MNRKKYYCKKCIYIFIFPGDFPSGYMVKNKPAMQETERREFDPWVGKIPWRRAWKPTPVFLPGESPWTEEPGGLQSTGLQRVGHN